MLADVCEPESFTEGRFCLEWNKLVRTRAAFSGHVSSSFIPKTCAEC
jgi:hypothetical protein